jgi:hypothetical protein
MSKQINFNVIYMFNISCIMKIIKKCNFMLLSTLFYGQRNLDYKYIMNF